MVVRDLSTMCLLSYKSATWLKSIQRAMLNQHLILTAGIAGKKLHEGGETARFMIDQSGSETPSWAKVPELPNNTQYQGDTAGDSLPLRDVQAIYAILLRAMRNSA